MGNSSSLLSQYDLEDLQNHCSKLFSQREIIALYERFCQLDRTGKGFISADEFMSVPEFAVNPLCQIDQQSKHLVTFIFMQKRQQELLAEEKGSKIMALTSILTIGCSLTQKVPSPTN